MAKKDLFALKIDFAVCSNGGASLNRVLQHHKERKGCAIQKKMNQLSFDQANKEIKYARRDSCSYSRI